MRRAHYQLPHVQALKAESVHFFRKVAADFERPVLPSSGGMDSIVMPHLTVRPSGRPAYRYGDARRHRACSPEVIVARPPGRRDRPAADRRLGAGVDRQRPGP